MLQKAIQFAAVKHSGQLRKWTNEPYVFHPLSVMEKVKNYLPTHVPKEVKENMMIAAVLHDTVEDTDATIPEISAIFGETVANYVWYLSDTPKFAGNRAHRKNLDAERLAVAPNEVKVIKLFDFLDNAPSIKENDPRFYQTFLLEKNYLFEKMDFSQINFYGDDELSRFTLV